MNKLVEALGPIFVASFALQQLLELVDPALDLFIRKHKAWIMSAIAFVFGLLLTLLLNLRVISVFAVTQLGWLDTLVTALFISGGTKWLNDLLKIVQYRKLELRARAMKAQKSANQETVG
jgi:hypothetical protein